MSYDLNFWKYSSEPGDDCDHQNVYEQLSDGQKLEGVEELPIDDILKRISEVFRVEGWEKLGDLSWEGGQAAFEIYTTSQFFRINCYGVERGDMNKFIDIASEFECSLYDPQVPQRFTIGWY